MERLKVVKKNGVRGVESGAETGKNSCWTDYHTGQ